MTTPDDTTTKGAGIPPVTGDITQTNVTDPKTEDPKSNVEGDTQAKKLPAEAPGTQVPPPAWKKGILKVLALPVIVGLLHLANNYRSGTKEVAALQPLPQAPRNGVVFAKLGVADAKGIVSDAGTPLSPVSLTLWVRNLDGWLMDRGEGNEELLRGSGFTSEQWRLYRDRNDGKIPAHDRVVESQFQDWFKTVHAAHGAALSPNSAPKPLEEYLLTWGEATPVNFLPTAERESLKADAKKLETVEQAAKTAFNTRLLKLVKEKPELIKTAKFISTATGTPEEQWKRLSSFLDERGQKAKNSKKDVDAFQAWFQQKRLQMRLVIGNQVFDSLKPDLLPNSSQTMENGGSETFHLLVFRDVKPEGEEEQKAWRSLIKTFGVACQAPVTAGIQVTDPKNGVNRHLLPTAVNGEAGQNKRTLQLQLRPVVMRSIAWMTALAVLCLLVVTGRETGVLRDTLPVGVVATPEQPYGPWSLSRVVFAWWLALCTSGYVYLWAMTGEFNALSGSAPLLLGIQGSTLLAASWVSQGTSSKSSQGFLNDLISENGVPEISRLQMVVWSGVLGVVFVWQTLAQWEMPTFGENITVLMGISSSAYVGYKQINKPKTQ